MKYKCDRCNTVYDFKKGEVVVLPCTVAMKDDRGNEVAPKCSGASPLAVVDKSAKV